MEPVPRNVTCLCQKCDNFVTGETAAILAVRSPRLAGHGRSRRAWQEKGHLRCQAPEGAVSALERQLADLPRPEIADRLVAFVGDARDELPVAASQ